MKQLPNHHPEKRWYRAWPLAGMGLVLLVTAVLALSGTGISAAALQGTPTAPTLVPPTPMPEQAQPVAIVPPDVSALASIQTDRVMRIGTLFNAAPFSWLNENGVVDGYEPEVLRAIAIDLGIDVEFVQVTRHNAEDMLLSGEVDVLIGQQVHTRARDEVVDFTHPYFSNAHRMVVRTDSPHISLAAMAGLPISVEIGSRSHRALLHWSEMTGITFDVRTYLTEREALDALENGDVEGMVGVLDSLRRAGRQGMRLVDEPVLTEPYAVVLRRYDVNLRNLLNRSLQKLKASGRLDQIFNKWFSEDLIDFDALVPVYEALYQDERTVDDFPFDIPYPPAPVMERIAQGQPLRVAGLVINETEPPAQARITDGLSRAMIEYMAAQWGAQIEYIPESSRNAVDLVANGQADIAVGVSPRWDGADRVEYSQPYIQHGDRLLVPVRSDVEGFEDMLGTGWIIGYNAEDGADADHIRKFAEIFNVSANVRDPFQIYNEGSAIYTMVVENNISAIFGDSLWLMALMREGDAQSVRLLDTWYGDVLPITFAMPRNDIDFRTVVNFTLQDMVRDGTYQRLWNERFGLGDPLTIPVWSVIDPDAPLAEE